MYIIDPVHPPQSAILQILARDPGITQQELQEKLMEEYGLSIEEKNLYAKLGKLQKHQLILRSKGRLSLNMRWIDSMAQFFSETRDNYHEHCDMFDLPRKAGQSLSVSASSIMALEPTWQHLSARIADIAGDSVRYAFTRHAYFMLGIPEEEQKFLSKYKASGVAFHLVAGGDTFLDRHGITQLNGQDNAKGSTTKKDPFDGRYAIVSVCGPFVQECTVPEGILGHLDHFFETITDLKTFRCELFTEIFSMSAQVTLEIRHDAKEAERIRKGIKKELS